jgi:hypothetical protein
MFPDLKSNVVLNNIINLKMELQLDELEMLREYFDKNETEKFLRKVSGLVNLEFDLVNNTGGIVEMAVEADNLSAVKYLTTKCGGNWDPKSQFGTQCLIESVTKSDEMCKYLIDQGCTITVKIIYQQNDEPDHYRHIKNNVAPKTMIKQLTKNGYDIKSLGSDLLVMYLRRLGERVENKDELFCNDMVNIFIKESDFSYNNVIQLMTIRNMRLSMAHLNKLMEQAVLQIEQAVEVAKPAVPAKDEIIEAAPKAEIPNESSASSSWTIVKSYVSNLIPKFD